MYANNDIEIGFTLAVFDRWLPTEFQAQAIKEEVKQKCGGGRISVNKGDGYTSSIGLDFLVVFNLVKNEIDVPMGPLLSFIELEAEYKKDPISTIRVVENIRQLDGWMNGNCADLSNAEEVLEELRDFPRFALLHLLYDPRPDKATIDRDLGAMKAMIENHFDAVFGWPIDGSAMPAACKATEDDVQVIWDYLFSDLIGCKTNSNYDAFLNGDLTEDQIADNEKRLAAAVAVLARTNP